MKISVITPAQKGSRVGNRTTAVRWARILRRLGHRVKVAVEYADQPADMMVALHAWRSAAAVERFYERHPERPLIVALTGTDIYRFLESHPETTLRSMDLADALVCLHALVYEAIPDRFQKKLQVIYQSAPPLPRRLPPSKRYFDVCVISNLRDDKDPMRTALAVRDLPETSRIRVTHLGKALDESWADTARAEMARNPRYHWRGEVPGWTVRRVLAKARVMVLSSRREGGANVVSEAAVAGVPVIASEIAGSVGLLGREYPGYYPVEDTRQLARLLHRAERETDFLDALRRHCAERKSLFRPEREQAAWKDLLRLFT